MTYSLRRSGSAYDGLSLIELLVAVALTALMILAAGAATLGSIRSNQVSEQHTIASELAEDVMECVRASLAGQGAVANACMPPARPGFTVFAPDIPDPDVITPPNMESIRVRVSWTGHAPGTITLHSMTNDDAP